MKYRRLGNSDMEISEVSFGCMSLEEDFEKTKELIHVAFDKGINYFDTADIYQNGNNEEMLGKAVKSFRDKIIIGTKVGNQLRATGEGWDWNPSKKYIINSVEKSLTRLKTDYIDLYQLHGGTIDDPIEETIDAFETLKKEGKIRYYGISSIRPNVIREYVKQSNISSVMMQYSLLDRRPEEYCLELLSKNTIGVLTRGSIAKGLLAGKRATEYLEYSSSDVDMVVEKLRESFKEDRFMCQVAVQFVLNHKAITSSVVGFRTKKQMEECITISEREVLSDKELNSLKSVISPLFYKNHR